MTSIKSKDGMLELRVPETAPIINRLKDFQDKLQRIAATRAARKGMKVVKEAAVRRAEEIDDPKTKEKIYKNIVVKNYTREGRRIGGIVMKVGVMGGARQYANTKRNVRAGRAGKKYNTAGDKGNPGGDTWYWRFPEFGTRRARKAKRFMRNALAENAQKVADVTFDQLNKEIDKLVAKYGPLPGTTR